MHAKAAFNELTAGVAANRILCVGQHLGLGPGHAAFVVLDLHVLGEELGMLLKLPNEGRYGERFCRWQTGYKHEQLDRKYACCCTQRKLALRSRTASDPLTARLRKAWLDPARA